MKILLTGHRGFVGQNLVLALGGKNELQFIDQNEYQKTNNIPEKVKWCDVVAHIGAVADTLNYDKNYMIKNNFDASVQLFDLAKKHNKKVVFASSAAIYGNEENFLSPYAKSKKDAEEYGLKNVNNFVSLRYFNIYGPGEAHKGKMASVACQALIASHTGQVPFRLFEFDHKNSPTRDFIYIKDVIGATKHAILSDQNTGYYDVGTAESNTFETVLTILHIPYQLEKVLVPEHYQMYTKAKKEKWLNGWTPKYNLTSGLSCYKSWWSSQAKHYQ